MEIGGTPSERDTQQHVPIAPLHAISSPSEQQAEITCPLSEGADVPDAPVDAAVAAVRALESHIHTLMDAEPGYIRWRYPERGLPHDIVGGQMDVGVLTVEADHKLSIAWWLGRDSYATGPYGYTVRDLEHGPMLQWPAGIRSVEDVRAISTEDLKPVQVSDTAGRLAVFAELLSQGTPVDEDILQAPADSIHQRPPLKAVIDFLCRRMAALPPELFE